MSRKHAHVTIDGTQYRVDIEAVKKEGVLVNLKIVSYEPTHTKGKFVSTGHESAPRQVDPMETIPYTGVAS